jgi:hypothetical protein
MKFLVCLLFIVAVTMAQTSREFENLFSTKKMGGDKISVICEYFTSFDIDSVYSIERDKVHTTIITPKKKYELTNSSIISIITPSSTISYKE